MPMIEKLMARVEGGFASLDRVAVTVGPGSFTGIRIGVAAARGIALARGLDVVGVSTLAAFAAPLLFGGRRWHCRDGDRRAAWPCLFFGLWPGRPHPDLAPHSGGEGRLPAAGRRPRARGRIGRRPAARGSCFDRREYCRRQWRSGSGYSRRRPAGSRGFARQCAGAADLSQSPRRPAGETARREAGQPMKAPFFFSSRHAPTTSRLLRVTDAAACARLHRTSFAHPWSTAEFGALMNDPACVADGIAIKSSLAGFILSRRAADEAEMLTIVVAPGSRRHGHGQRLLAAHLARLAALRRQATCFLKSMRPMRPRSRFIAASDLPSRAGARAIMPSRRQAGDALIMRRALA